MTRRNYALLTGTMLIAILLTNFGLFAAPVVPHESVEQEHGWCIKECKERYGIDVMRGGRRGGNSGQYFLYAKCIDDCEKKFWKEWDKRLDERGED